MEENTQQTNYQTSEKKNNLGIYMVIAMLVILAIGGGLYAYKKASQSAKQSVIQTPMQQPTKTEIKDNKMTATESQKMATTSPSAMDAMKATVTEITITGNNFSFEPKTISAKKGQKIKLTFKNAQGMHDFVIDAFKVATKRIKSGELDTVEFTPDKAGTFQYYCSVGKHREMGMVGTLTVE